MMGEMTFEEWLIDQCVIRGIGHADAQNEVQSFLAGNYSTYTARVRRILAQRAHVFDPYPEVK
jgi:hypothetical protein